MVQRTQERTQQPIATELVGCDKWRGLVGKYEWDTKVAMAVMEAETSCRHDAVGDTWPIGGVLAPSCGLFQIRTLPGRPTCEELKNPEVNVDWAYRLYKSSGFTPWTMYNNGRYLQYVR